MSSLFLQGYSIVVDYSTDKRSVIGSLCVKLHFILAVSNLIATFYQTLDII